MSDQLTQSELNRQAIAAASLNAEPEGASSEKVRHTGWQDPKYNTEALTDFKGVEPGNRTRWDCVYGEALAKAKRLVQQKEQNNLNHREKEELKTARRRVQAIRAWARDQDIGAIRQEISDISEDDERKAYLKSVELLIERVEE